MKTINSCLLTLCLLLTVMTSANAEQNQPKNSRLTMGFMPYVAASTLMEKYTPLADYLTRELGRPVVIEVAKNYAEHLYTDYDLHRAILDQVMPLLKQP